MNLKMALVFIDVVKQNRLTFYSIKETLFLMMVLNLFDGNLNLSSVGRPVSPSTTEPMSF